MQISNTDRPKNYTSHGNTSAKRHPAGHNFPAVQITALLFQNSVPRQVFTFYNAFLLPGSVQQMDFCVNGRGFASSLRRSIDTKIHLLFLSPKQKSLIANAVFITLIFIQPAFCFYNPPLILSAPCSVPFLFQTIPGCFRHKLLPHIFRIMLFIPSVFQQRPT